MEPRFIYLKALYHAVTSFVLPDPFSGMTGTEEALQCLNSGYSQPWAPLSDVEARHVLTSIASLSPKRTYYPPSMKVMQTTSWHSQLSAFAQHDDYSAVVRSILQQSKILETFSPNLESERFRGLFPEPDNHLTQRARFRNSLYRRQELIAITPVSRREVVYETRAPRSAMLRRAKVFEAASLVRDWSSHIAVPSNLAELFQQWPLISGFNAQFDRTLVSDLINVNLAESWGPLFRLCRDARQTDRHRFMFLFAMIAFNESIDMMLVRALIALTVKAAESLRLTLPEWESYTNFRQYEVPTINNLVLLIHPAIVPYPEDERYIHGIPLDQKSRRKLLAARKLYEKQAEEDCRAIARKLTEQWPCLRPKIPSIDRDVLVNMDQAVSVVQEGWEGLFRNHELHNHLLEVQNILRSCKPQQKYDSKLTHGHGRSTKYNHLNMACDLPSLTSLLRSACMEVTAPASASAFHTEVSSYQPAHLGTLPNGFNYRPVTTAQTSSINIVPTSFAEANTYTNFISPADQTNTHHAEENEEASHPVTIQEVDSEMRELRNIVSIFAESPNAIRRNYGRDFMTSIEALKASRFAQMSEQLKAIPKQITVTADMIAHQGERVSYLFAQICATLQAVAEYEAPWLGPGDLWPRMTPLAVLASIQSKAKTLFGSGLYENIIDYGVEITSLQHLHRNDCHAGKFAASTVDSRDLGHDNWRPRDYPDWLLLEIESNILIRPDQVKVALATISPPSGSNSVLQMNMGQGKTSCIIPLAAAVLADASSLLRVIVPRPLLLQMAVILQQRLGGLLGRSIKHVPFSRRTPTDSATVDAYQEIHRRVLVERGVVLALPEHILSLKLSGQQKLLDGFKAEARHLIDVQQWLDKTARDILDECDHTLAVKTQLIYPSGAQKTVDGHPNRWKTAETLFQIVKDEIRHTARDFPKGIDVKERPGNGFPIIHFLQKPAEDAMIQHLIDVICKGKSPLLSMGEGTSERRVAVEMLLRERRITRKDVTGLFRRSDNDTALRNDLLLLRGLLVHRILLMVLKRRWNVQYGLHPNRDPVAVPFLSKGIPSEQAEFGHVDVSLTLTCLSFYFSGLRHDQLRQSFEHLLKSDDPDTEYNRWTQHVDNLPQYLRHWNSINLEDTGQLNDLWMHCRYNMVIINHYLNNFVFPRYAKVFERSLRQSAWDLPQFASAPGPGTPKAYVAKPAKFRKPQSRHSMTTGFSGTNDNRYMLPLTIRQQDLPELTHTNAEVLTYLLQKRNRRYLCVTVAPEERRSEQAILGLLHRNGKIRILIDAGAQILEMSNLELVAAWLLIDTEAPAAVYFGIDNKLWVRHRDGKIFPLIASPYANNLEKCLIYLDEAHCRGTDLKLPKHAVGALTLGPGQTKDTTVQG